ncbi:8777_t:CDS:1, partial [Dentiscutata erythropus]
MANLLAKKHQQPTTGILQPIYITQALLFNGKINISKNQEGNSPKKFAEHIQLHYGPHKNIIQNGRTIPNQSTGTS